VAHKRRDLPENIQKLVKPHASSLEVKLAEDSYQTGIQDGLLMGYGEILSLLESKYMGHDAPGRGTPEATAILALAHELGNQLREKIEAASAN